MNEAPKKKRQFSLDLFFPRAVGEGEKINRVSPFFFSSEEIKISGENVVIKMALSTFYYFVLPDSEVL